MKKLLRLLSIFSFAISIVLADIEKDFKEIENYLLNGENGSYGDVYYDDIDNKNFIEIYVYSEMPNDIAKKVFAYDTIEVVNIRTEKYENVIDALKYLPSVKELNFEHNIESIISSVSLLKNIKRMRVDFDNINQSDIETISKVTGLEELVLEIFEKRVDQFNFDSLKNLNLTKFELTFRQCDNPSFIDFVYEIKSLKSLTLYSRETCLTKLSDDIGKLKSLEYLDLSTYLREIPDQLANLVNLKYLDLSNNSLLKFPKQILSLKNLQKLKLRFCNVGSIPEEIDTLKYLEYLDLSENGLKEIPKQIGNLKNLKFLDLSGNKLETIMRELANLENLEELYLGGNIINDYLPSSFNNLKHLKYFSIYGNNNIIGPMLTNESLETCLYSPEFEVCKMSKTVKCLEENDKYPLCSNQFFEEESKNDDCGKGKGRCPNNQCCNKNGKCTEDEDQCSVGNGCQYGYGLCISECQEAYNYVDKHAKNDLNYVIECHNNDQGHAKSLTLLRWLYQPVLLDDELLKYKEIEYLEFNGVISSGFDLKELKNLPKLTNLTIDSYESNNPLREIPKDIFSLTTLKNLTIINQEITSVPKDIVNLKNLEYIDLSGNLLTKIPKELTELKNLKYINLSRNQIDDTLPESYNNFSNLKEIYLDENIDIKGKILTNDSLEICLYDRNYSLCKDKHMKCLDEPVYFPSTCYHNCYNYQNYKLEDVKFCPGAPGATETSSVTENPTEKPNTTETSIITETSSVTETSIVTENPTEKPNTTETSIEQPTEIPTNSDDTKISKDGKCGKGIGKCPEGLCCSKYGWCGKTEKHCSIDEGCNSEFGRCNSSVDKISTNSRCGGEYGRCPKDQCCSKYGWCGKSEKHCSIDKGCNSKFGQCQSSSISDSDISLDGRCGDKYGKCPKGQCCSKYGWCGASKVYCAVNNGCNPKFGKCDNITESVNGKCGNEYGRCPKGNCCSRYGWCGKSDDHCGKGCQSEFGECH